VVVSDSDATGDEGKDKGAEQPRPSSAAARRERRASARAGGDGDGADGKAKARPSSKNPAAKGRAAAARPPGAGQGRVASRHDREEERLPLHQRIARYIREVIGELQKVIWPTRKQMVTYTSVVLAFMAFMVALVFVLDLGFHRVAGAVFGD
jgi:preprotein translocase subunit SecE